MLPRAILVLLFCLTGFAPAQQRPDAWQPFRYFVGSWTGTGEGQPGTSKVDREYRFILNGRFLQETNRSVYEPQQKTPNGEVHEDTGIMSFDRSRKKFVFRQFHVEGFVNQYASEAVPPEAKTVVFTSEAIENIPSGWRARETYKILGPDEFEAVFELAEPGKGFELYSRSRLKRKK